MRTGDHEELERFALEWRAIVWGVLRSLEIVCGWRGKEGRLALRCECLRQMRKENLLGWKEGRNQ